jgi:hypothetical protein
VDGGAPVFVSACSIGLRCNWHHLARAASKILIAVLAVLALLLPRSPANISWLIASVVIDPVQRQSWRSGTYVREECREIVCPFCTHLDSTSTIAVICRVAWVCAPLLCRGPRGVFF